MVNFDKPFSSMVALSAVLCVVSSFSPSPTWAQEAPTEQNASSKLETVREGELRLDGKIVLISGAKQWQIQALSWTSPRGVTTSFPEPREKTVRLNEQTLLHPRGEDEKIAASEVKVGTRVAVIGTNQKDGSLLVREVVLLEGYGSRRTIGQVASNPLTVRFVNESRQARERGEIPRALELARQAISSAQAVRDLGGEGLATQDLALLLMDSEQFKEAFAASERVVALGEASNSQTLQALGLTGTARLLLRGGEAETALERLERARNLSASIDAGLHANVLSLTVYALLELARTDEAINVLNALAPVEDQARQTDDATETLLRLALVQSRTDSRAAREALERAIPRVESVKKPENKPNLLVLLGAARFNLGERDEAQKTWNEARTLLEQSGKTADAAKISGLQARLEAAGDDQRALFSFGLNEQPSNPQPQQEVD